MRCFFKSFDLLFAFVKLEMRSDRYEFERQIHICCFIVCFQHKR